MLFKHATDTARGATGLFLDSGINEDEVGGAAVEITPSPEEIQLAAAHKENAELRSRLANQQSEWQTELAKAKEEARREAAAQHVHNDKKLLEILSKSLEVAKQRFEHELRLTLQPAVTSLAKVAIQRFVQMRENDEDWLSRVIARRLETIQAQTIVMVSVPECTRTGDGQMLGQAEMPKGTKIEFDPSLVAGNARIDLNFGSIPIRAGEGLRRLLAQIDEGQEDG